MFSFLLPYEKWTFGKMLGKNSKFMRGANEGEEWLGSLQLHSFWNIIVTTTLITSS